MARLYPLAGLPVTLTDAATIAVNAAAGNYFKVTLTASRTMGVPTNPVDGQLIMFQIKQGGTGSYTINWTSGAAGYQFGTVLVAPTLDTAVGAYNYVGFRFDATANRWNCLAALGGFT
jgi:hypothetical protein